MIKLIEKYPVASLLLFIVIMLGFTISAIPVSIMEARNYISAREMLTDNHWILTTMNGEARYEKPPLPTWITAFFVILFGIKNIIAVRLPSILMIAITGISIYYLSLKLTKDKNHSLINGFLVMTSFYVIGITLEGTWDIYTHGFMLIALYQLFTVLKQEQITAKNAVLFVVFIAASVLSKGPVSLYVLLFSFLIAYGFSFQYKSKHKFHYIKLVLLLIAGIGIGAIWYLYVRQADPETFNKIASRETGNWSSYNVRPFYYYWSFFVQSGLWTVFAFVSLFYPYLKNKVAHKKAYKFSFLWTIIAVILLSIIPEKKSRYLMPVLIPLAINMGFYVNYVIRNFKYFNSKKERFPVYFQFGLVGLIAVLFPISGFFLKADLTDTVLIRFIFSSIIIVIIGINIFRSLRLKHIKKTFYLTLSFMLCIGLFVLPFAKLLKQKDYKPIETFDPEKAPFYSINYLAPEMIYNYGDKIPSIGTDEEFDFPFENKFYLLSNSEKLNDNLKSNYTTEFIDIYDLNTPDKTAKGYKERLVNYLFKLEKK